MKFEDRLADRGRWRADRCSIAAMLEALGTRTTFLVVRECFYGTTRFDDFVDRTGVSAPAVSRAMHVLESAEVVVRVPYQDEGSRVRDGYQLTSAGEDLLPVLLAMIQWGDTYLQEATPPLVFVERNSGRPVKVRVTADGIDDLGPADIEVRRPFARDLD
ncbi:helix-turn-helix transcriptional regulator [Rhodococcus fascians]|nr:helix-turn-helix transcriptional regulator [Rhodococcus fascians]